jgi:hypothetical protein
VYGVKGREIREQREMPAGSRAYISRSLFLKREIEKKTGNPGVASPLPAQLQEQLEAQLALANDPDRQLAFDERAAFLEFECGLSRAEAERQAADEIVPAPPMDGSLAVWRAGLARLSHQTVPCPDYRGDEWPFVYANALGFLDTFGEQAAGLGWTTLDLFGVHPVVGTIRVDHCGALVLSVGGRVRLVTADEIRFDSLTHRRKPDQPRGLPVWEFSR